MIEQNTIVTGFNPRSREGSDSTSERCICLGSVSIHAPAKGATMFSCQCVLFNFVSIHAPAKGATVSVEYLINGKEVSIHAPAKGATKMGNGSMYHVEFQSTLPRRERLSVNDRMYIRKSRFQSTLPRRERRYISVLYKS